MELVNRSHSRLVVGNADHMESIGDERERMDTDAYEVG